MSRGAVEAAAAVLIAAGLFLLLFPSFANAQSWKTAEASVYGPWEGETVTAIGTRITDSTMGIAVPMSQVVSRKAWKRNKSSKWRKNHFYYGERIKLRHKAKSNGRWKTYTCTAVVRDCGGFYGYGRTYRGRWIPRQFDLQPAVKRALRCGDLSVVSWKWVR